MIVALQLSQHVHKFLTNLLDGVLHKAVLLCVDGLLLLVVTEQVVVKRLGSLLLLILVEHLGRPTLYLIHTVVIGNTLTSGVRTVGHKLQNGDVLVYHTLKDREPDHFIALTARQVQRLKGLGKILEYKVFILGINHAHHVHEVTLRVEFR